MKLYKKVAILLHSIKAHQKYKAKHHSLHYITKLQVVLRQNLPVADRWYFNLRFDVKRSTVNELIVSLNYLHLAPTGAVTANTAHDIIFTPDLINDFKIEVTGENTNNIHDYLTDRFTEIFQSEVK